MIKRTSLRKSSFFNSLEYQSLENRNLLAGLTNAPLTGAEQIPQFHDAVLHDDQLFFGGDFGKLWVGNLTDEAPATAVDFKDGAPFVVQDLKGYDEGVAFLGYYEDGYSVWISDGTTRGTVPLLNRSLEAQERLPVKGLQVSGSKIFYDGDNAIWAVDANTGSHQLIHDDWFEFVEAEHKQGRIFFLGPRNIWVTNGTSEGTVALAETARFDFGGGIYFEDQFYFINENRLWKTDGTVENTLQVSDLYIEKESLTVFEDGLGFVAGLASAQTLDLWGIFPGQSEPMQLAEVNLERRDNGSSPSLIRVSGDMLGPLYLNDRLGGDLIVYRDGAVTTLKESVEVASWIQDGENLMFQAGSQRSVDSELWFSDATVGGTRELELFSSLPPTFENDLVLKQFEFQFAFGGDFYFDFNSNYENSSWVSDGTEEGTQRFNASNENQSAVRMAQTAVGDNLLLLARNEQEFEFKLYLHDGESASEIRDFGGLDFAASNRELMWSLGDKAVFFVDSKLWVSDGTLDGTFALETFEDVHGIDVDLMHVGDGKVVLRVAGGIWISDGSIDGTFRLDRAGTSFTTNELGAVYFGIGSQIYVSENPTDGESKLVAQLPGPVSQLDGVGANLFFAVSGEAGNEPWISDGTESGTTLIADVNPEGSSNPRDFVALGQNVAFRAFHPEFGREFWITDGTEVGTELLVDLRPGASSSSVGELLSDGDFLYALDSGPDNLTIISPDGDVSYSEYDVAPSSFRVMNGLVYYTPYSFRYDDYEVGNPVSFVIDPVAGQEQFAFRGGVSFTTEVTLNSLYLVGDSEVGVYTAALRPVVTNSNDAGPGSLRQAILDANQNSGATEIVFQVSQGQPLEIVLESQLPDLDGQVIINGPVDIDSDPLVTLAGNSVNGHGLVLRGEHSRVSNLRVTGFSGDGIQVVSDGFVKLDNVEVFGNGRHGVNLDSGKLNRLTNSLIYGHGGSGIFIGAEATAVIVDSNQIGVDELGIADGNLGGVRVRGAHSLIFDNTISGNQWVGIGVLGELATHTRIDGNYIGTDRNGNELGNESVGIYVLSDFNSIGLSSGNVIGFNGVQGVLLKGADENFVYSNMIGYDWEGRVVGNEGGAIRAIGTRGLKIDSNVIGGNGSGIFVGGVRSEDVSVKNNFVGITSDDTIIPNEGIGMTFNSNVNGVVYGNVIAGNEGGGIYSTGTASNSYYVNRIGVNQSSTQQVSNGNFGMYIVSSENVIGDAGLSNTIGNWERSVVLRRSSGNTVSHNFFGTDPEMEFVFPLRYAISVVAMASQNEVSENFVANAEIGIWNPNGGEGNRFSVNSFVDTNVGIDNWRIGLDENDAGDFDRGPNRRQNSPLINSAILETSQLQLVYFVDSDPGFADYELTIEFYLEGRDRVGSRYLGQDVFTIADYTSQVDKVFELEIEDITLDIDDEVVAIAIDSSGNTSEFGFSQIIS